MMKEVRILKSKSEDEGATVADKLRLGLHKQFVAKFALSHDLGECPICAQGINV
jgi:hypothetical protein